jgi:hypothetical protein
MITLGFESTSPSSALAKIICLVALAWAFCLTC